MTGLAQVPAMTPELARQVLAGAYGLDGQILDTAGHNLRVLAVSFGQGEHMLKLQSPAYAAKVPVLEEILRALEHSGHLPAVVSGLDGSRLVRHRDDVFLLQRRSAGQSPRGASELARAAQALARLHRSLRAVDPAQVHSHFETDMDILEDFAARLGQPSWPEVLRLARQRMADIAPQVVHGDPHPGNVLVHGERVEFIDFDSAASQPAEVEAGFAAYRLSGGDVAATEVFLAAYAAAAGQPPVPTVLALAHAFYLTLQRAHFIVQALLRGDDTVLWDLPCQFQRLHDLGAAISEQQGRHT